MLQLVTWAVFLFLVLCGSATAPHPDALTISIHNTLDKDVDVYWFEEATRSDKLISQLKASRSTEMDTFANHVFKFKTVGDGRLVGAFIVDREMSEFYIEVKHEDGSEAFRKEYLERTGRRWINTYPRAPVSHPVHTPQYVGQRIQVDVNHLEGTCSSIDSNAISEAYWFPTPWRSFSAKRSHTLEVLSIRPGIMFIDDFLTDEECEHFIAEGLDEKLKPSTVGMEASSVVDRTSSNAWLLHDRTPVIAEVTRRAFQYLGIPYTKRSSHRVAESYQLVHYDVSQEYRAHYDYFPVNSPGTLGGATGTSRNRLATLFIYLNDVEEGGETYFPRHNGTFTSKGCENPDGFKVKPKKGSATLFYSMLPDGNLDFDSLHGGCPVKRGSKYGANLWFWDPIFRT